MNQQSQTLDYFKSHAEEWQKISTSEAYSLVENRHLAVLETMKCYPENAALLDVGCGTGQLAIEASRRGWAATGIDFAQEMIDICLENNSKAQTGARFECASIFDMEVRPQSFDVISAQGFIEYISLSQLDDFLDFLRTAVTDNGAVVLGSRNRLFNVHSLNAFTELETALGTLGKLVTESIILQTSGTQEEALTQLERLRYDYEQPAAHPLTGVAVDTRYQFSPADLITRLARHRLRATRIYPVHYHALPVTMMSDEPGKDLHAKLAKFASAHWICRHNIVPYSSSFVMEAKPA